jgi:hypothetical protein
VARVALSNHYSYGACQAGVQIVSGCGHVRRSNKWEGGQLVAGEEKFRWVDSRMILTGELKVRGMREGFHLTRGGSAVIDMCGL